MAVQTEEIPRTGTAPEIGRNNRAGLLDMLRGIAILYVMLYHLLYDFIWIGGADLPFFYSGWWEAVHRFFLVILFAVSGVCGGMSRNVLRRGAVLYLLGELLTLFTDIIMPEDVIVFGVLSCFGMIMLIYGVLERFFKKLPGAVTFVLFTVLAVIFWDFPETGELLFGAVRLDLPADRQWLYPIGITSADFHSEDYFPLVPYGFVFLAGTAFSDCVKSGSAPKLVYRARLPVINFCGRHSLWLYILHQPVFMAAVFLAARIFRR